MTFGIDYAWGRPSVSALKSAGVEFVCRYLSGGGSKDLSRAEADVLSAAGISIIVVFETTAAEAESGHGAGQADARAALAEADACGMPAGRPIYFAVDEDTVVGPHISGYFQGVNSVLGVARTGCYGDETVLQALFNQGLISWGWQTYAWSGGVWEPRAHLEQYSNDHTLDGVGVDYNRSVKTDFGQWRVGQAPTPEPQEDDMPQGQLNYGKTGATTTLSVPKGKLKFIGLAADNGVAGHAPVKLRIAQHLGGGNWRVEKDVVVDSGRDKTTRPLDPSCDEVSISYEDDGLVPVGWDAS